jgi:hypothetical protein
MLGFASFFIEGCQPINNSGNPTGPLDPTCESAGNHFQIMGSFVSILEIEGDIGDFDEFGTVAIRLVE